jgi:hypothetical protein
LAQPAVVNPPKVWHCALHELDGAGVQSFTLTRLDNGYYSNDTPQVLTVLADREQALILASPMAGVIDGDFHEFIGAQTLAIDRRRRLARLSWDFLTGVRDKTFFGTCTPVSPDAKP